MDARRRQELVRVAAPVAFLLVVTVAVLLVRSSLRHHHSAAPAKPVAVKHPRRHTSTGSAVVPVATSGTDPYVAPTTTATTTAAATGPTYTVAAGDTLGSIATKEHTTVDALLAANPGVDPTGLQIGDTIHLP